MYKMAALMAFKNVIYFFCCGFFDEKSSSFFISLNLKLKLTQMSENFREFCSKPKFYMLNKVFI